MKEIHRDIISHPVNSPLNEPFGDAKKEDSNMFLPRIFQDSRTLKDFIFPPGKRFADVALADEKK